MWRSVEAAPSTHLTCQEAYCFWQPRLFPKGKKKAFPLWFADLKNRKVPLTARLAWDGGGASAEAFFTDTSRIDRRRRINGDIDEASRPRPMRPPSWSNRPLGTECLRVAAGARAYVGFFSFFSKCQGVPGSPDQA